MLAKCMYCGHEVDTNQTGSYREIRGWERVRSEGGANMVVERQETGRAACKTCIDLRALKISPRQSSLL